MTSRARSGEILVSGRVFPATITLSVVRVPGRAVGRQHVEVEFHGEAPPNHELVIARQVTFREEQGGDHILQYGGSRWTLKDAEGFLE